VLVVSFPFNDENPECESEEGGDGGEDGRRMDVVLDDADFDFPFLLATLVPDLLGIAGGVAEEDGEDDGRVDTSGEDAEYLCLSVRRFGVLVLVLGEGAFWCVFWGVEVVVAAETEADDDAGAGADAEVDAEEANECQDLDVVRIVVNFFLLSSFSLSLSFESFEPNLSPPNPKPNAKPKDFPLPFSLFDVPFACSPPPTPVDTLYPFACPLVCDKPCSPRPTSPPSPPPISSSPLNPSHSRFHPSLADNTCPGPCIDSDVGGDR